MSRDGRRVAGQGRLVPSAGRPVPSPRRPVPSPRRAVLGPPVVVVVGSASRDIAEDDPRGWQLGGAVTYGALTCARLGLPTAALVGADELAAGAAELDVLRQAGVDVRIVPLRHAPVFANIESPSGRVQECLDPGLPLPISSLPPEWRSAQAWLLGPVAGELEESWADVPDEGAVVAFGWQGILRRLRAGESVERVAPGPSRFLRRADIVGISRDDVSRETPLALLCGELREGAELLLTLGDAGGAVVHVRADRSLRIVQYHAAPASVVRDPTGAGDVMLASLMAARVALAASTNRSGADRAATRRHDLQVAAAAASLVVEGPGVTGVPWLDAIRRRLAEAGPAGASQRLDRLDTERRPTAPAD